MREVTIAQLEVISSYTLLQSTITIDALVNAAKEKGYHSIALTDRNVLYGAVEFYEKARQQQLNPIIGLTLDIQSIHESEKSFPLVLLAKNEKGYQQLVALSSLYMTREQAILPEEVVSKSSDLIVFTPGEGGEIEYLLLEGRKEEAKEVASYWNKHLPTFYFGISFSHIKQNLHPIMKELAQETGSSLIASSSVQYLNKEDSFATKVLQTIEAGEQIDLEAPIEQAHYLRGTDEIEKAYKSAGLEKAVEQTQLVAESVQIELTLGQPVLPKFPIPNGEATDTYLHNLCFEQLEKRVKEVDQRYKDRLEKELSIISKMGFSDYFLIVWDVMTYAHREQIVTGSGRGSAAGSLVAYVLEITDVDPIQYDLLFERFLNEERFSMPDIDLDFPDNKREQILHYVNQKYGNDHVAQIATFGTFAAKMSIRDAGRVFGLSTQELKVWSNAIPSGVGMTLKQAHSESKALRELIQSDQKNRLIFDTAVRIEGLPRHVSTHAAGVVISDKPLIQSVPLQQGSGELSLTQFTMGDVEKVGLLKMDFLGLKNLTILADCLRFSQFEKNPTTLSLSDIPLNDPKTLAIFQRGDTNGVFQFESDGIKRVLKRISPTDIEDVVAVNALYRPGPMEQIDLFIKRKKGEETISYPHTDLKDILEVTYGVMVYQEQVMKVASQLAGYTLAEADILRRAISKKIKSEIDAGRKQFVAGATKKGYEAQTAQQVYDYIERFANYGFNRSHSVAYSMVAYQLAYFKAHHPAAFFAALMKSSSNNKPKLREYVLEAKKRNVEIKGPDINLSQSSFTLKNGAIQFGLNTIKGLRRDFIQNIWEERQANGAYQDLIDFLNRIADKWRKDTYIQPLLFAGAFDHLGENRGTYLRSLESVLESVKMSNGNTELFEMFAPRIEEVEDLSLEEKLEQEFDVTGFYFSGHPSEQFDYLRSPYKISYIADASKNKTMRFLGIVKNIKKIQTKKGEPMSFAELTDSSATCSLTIFPEQHRRFIKSFDKGDTIMVEGKIEQSGEEPKMIVRKIAQAQTLAEETPKQTLFLKFDSIQKQADAFQNVQNILKAHHGKVPVVVYEVETDQRHRLKEAFFMDGSSECLEKLRTVLPSEHVVLK